MPSSLPLQDLENVANAANHDDTNNSNLGDNGSAVDKSSRDVPATMNSSSSSSPQADDGAPPVKPQEHKEVVMTMDDEDPIKSKQIKLNSIGAETAPAQQKDSPISATKTEDKEHDGEASAAMDAGIVSTSSATVEDEQQVPINMEEDPTEPKTDPEQMSPKSAEAETASVPIAAPKTEGNDKQPAVAMDTGNASTESIVKEEASSSETRAVKNEEEKGFEEEDEEEERATLDDVYEALGDLATPGSTCIGGVASDLPPLPGLQVQGMGPVALPMTQETALKLKSVAKQVPHGRGMETVVDTSVRNTLQIDADQVTLDNPAWKAALGKLVGTAATALGVDAALVRPELYKLLLYETGGFFKKHRDTEKAQGMFATLVVQLPSRFEGGHFVVSHNGKTQTFCMDDKTTASYQCHYVAHYADCEHEILPVKSGHRLALIYSLCYTGKPTMTPTVQNLSQGGLVSVMSQLASEDSLFSVPLDHQYTTLSLACLGIGAFKGSDRALAQTISGFCRGWNMVVAQLERTDIEDVDGDDDYGDFDVVDKHEGNADWKAIFQKDGSSADVHSKWLKQQLSLSSIGDGGMILASEDEVQEMWGDGDSGDVEYTGNEGASRETTYTTCLLVVFSEHGVFERLCHSNFSGAVGEVVDNPELVDRALAFIRRKKPTISSSDLRNLHDVIRPDNDINVRPSYWSDLKVLVEQLDSNTLSPCSQALNSFETLVKEFGWNEQTEPIRSFLERLPANRSTSECSDFLPLVEVLLTMDSAAGGDPATGGDWTFLLPIFKDAIDRFEKSPVAEHGGHPYYRSHETDWEPYLVVEKILRLSNLYGWERVQPTVKSCFVRIQKTKKKRKSVDHLADQVKVLQKLAEQVSAVKTDAVQSNELEALVTVASDTEEIRSNVLEAFVALVEAKPNWSNVWTNPKAEVLVQELLTRGTPALFQRIQNWAYGAGASYTSLAEARSVVEKVNTSAFVCVHATAKEECVKAINESFRKLSIEHHQQVENELLRLTRDGKPIFSWRMANARTGNASVDTFLKGPDQGPSKILVGDGINNARRLAVSCRYGRVGYSRTNAEYRSNGYSAEIQNTEDSGRNASVVVTKTNQWYKAQLEEYKKNMTKLSEVHTKLREVGASHVQAPAAKRARTDVEVIEID
jgi:hypothetical protein